MADKKNGYHRVLLKLSGEVFGGEKGIGVDPDVVADVAEQIADVVKSGVEIAIVVGGGNYFRGAELQQRGMERARADSYIPRRSIRHLEKGRVVIFGAGAGMPFFTTDTVAAQRALEIGVDALLLAKSGVDGVYSADPRKDKDAKKYETITYDEVLSKSLAVADAAAFSLCRENKLPIIVFDLMQKGNIAKAVRGEKIGTLVN